MKVLVSFKSVPDANDVAVAGAVVATPKSVINPFDEIAIEEALRIRERGEATEIVGVTIGAPAVDEQIRAALAMGVDRAVRIDVIAEFRCLTQFRCSVRCLNGIPGAPFVDYSAEDSGRYNGQRTLERKIKDD